MPKDQQRRSSGISGVKWLVRYNWPVDLKFKWGDKVHRVGKTYEYPGVIVGFAYTTKGKIRYDVEATGPGYEEMLHIFTEEELELIPTETIGD